VAAPLWTPVLAATAGAHARIPSVATRYRDIGHEPYNPGAVSENLPRGAPPFHVCYDHFHRGVNALASNDEQ